MATTQVDTDMSTGVTTTTTTKNHDWWTILGGVCLAVLGFVVFAMPDLTLITLAIAAGIVFAIAGVVEIISYFAYKKSGLVSGWQVAGGICNIILAIIFLFNPVITAIMLPWLAGIAVAAYGIIAIVGGVQLRKSMPSSWGWFVANGIIALVCAVLFWVLPESFVLYLAIFFIFRGITMVVYGWSTKQTSVEVSQES